MLSRLLFLCMWSSWGEGSGDDLTTVTEYYLCISTFDFGADRMRGNVTLRDRIGYTREDPSNRDLPRLQRFGTESEIWGPSTDAEEQLRCRSGLNFTELISSWIDLRREECRPQFEQAMLQDVVVTPDSRIMIKTLSI